MRPAHGDGRQENRGSSGDLQETTLKACLTDLVGRGIVAYDDVVHLTSRPDEVKRPLAPTYPMAPTG